MLLSLNDCQAAFAQAAQAKTITVTVDGTEHVITTPFPSPEDWRDVWIYFIMLDRFNRDDGQPPKHMPYDTPFGEFQGGTYNGVRAQLKYIKELGAGALWLTPVLKNRQTDPGSYHGYGIQDFLQPEPRFASAPDKAEEELRALVDEAHALGLYVIFDIVLNHTGDVFGYKGHGSEAPYRKEEYKIEWRDETGYTCPEFTDIKAVPEGKLHPDGFIWPKELQRNAFFRRKGKYEDGKCDEKEGDFCSLKEFVTDFQDKADDDTSERVILFPVRNHLITAYQHAIAKYDADGFRIDTLKHVERDFARIFGNAMREYALSIGKKNFFTFGEVAGGREDKLAEYTGRNTNDSDGIVGVDAALDFPLFGKLPSMVKGFTAPREVVGVFEHRKEVQRNTLSSHGDASSYFVTFLDNHDQTQRIRWAESDAPNAFDQQIVLAVALLFGLQGIPCLYYGTEQGLHGHGDKDWRVREALWGKPSGFDRSHRFYKAIQELSRIRAEQPALRYGRMYFRPISGNGIHFGVSPYKEGVLAFSRILNNREVLVVANASTQQEFQGKVLVDWFLNKDGEQFHVLNNPAAASVAVKTGSGLEIHEVGGAITNGPAKMVSVRLKPMEVQIMAK